MIRVLLIDDHAIVREGFKRLIESSPDFLVVAEARNADEALSALERVSADIAVVDISLGDGASSGLDLIALLRDLMHGLRCVVLSMHDDSGLVLRALEQGARGYFTKAVAADFIKKGIRANGVSPGQPGFQGAARNGECRVYINASPVDSAELNKKAFDRLDQIIKREGGIEALAEDPEKIPQVHIRGDVNAPWKCVAGTIYQVQTAGYPTVGFISNPVDPNG